MWGAAEQERLAALLDELVPGSAAAGAVDYVEQLLDALDHDPPRLWAGRDGWIEPGPWERHAWTERLAGWRDAYDRLLAGDEVHPATDADRRMAFEHACEATFGDPVHGGNHDGAGWVAIDFPRPLLPPEVPGG